MKKLIVFLLFVFLLSGCSKDITYTTEDNIVLDLSTDSFRILQLTDLHLTFGIDNNDNKTFSLIEELVSENNPDLIVVTGDICMSPLSSLLFEKFVNYMEKLEKPWTFVFGNHDNDFTSYSNLLSKLKYEYLLFQIGPAMENGGYGNFEIELKYNELPFYNLYFLDTHNENSDGYGYLSSAQVTWYENHLVNDGSTSSLAFMHIPLQQYSDFTPDIAIDGAMNETKVYFQSTDTGFFDIASSYGLTKGVFVGHDHLNDFSFINNGILLAYGRVSGYNGYGARSYARGGRIIDINSSKVVTSHIVLGGN